MDGRRELAEGIQIYWQMRARWAKYTGESKTSSQRYVLWICIIHEVRRLGTAFEKLAQAERRPEEPVNEECKGGKWKKKGEVKKKKKTDYYNPCNWAQINMLTLCALCF